ncbi:MAG: hypothetical protein ACE5GY_09825 [Thermodesulfobacteriota bacterium]
MLGINVTVEGDRVVIEGLGRYERGIRERALPNALRRIASGTARKAVDRLSGPRRGLATVTARSGRKRAVPQRPDLAGGYPVPRLTGNLRRLLSWIGPGRAKEGFSTGPFEAMVFDSAQYAMQIHEGKGSSEKYGPRRFLDDAFDEFNAGARAAAIIEGELNKEAIRNGLE